MFNFSNYETFTDTATINQLNNSLNIYSNNMDTLINDIDTSFNDKSYSATENVGKHDSALIDLSGINVHPGTISLSSYNLSNYESSMNDIEVLVNEYDIKKQKLEKKITHYNSIISKLKDGKVNVNYYLMNIWIIILFVVGYASFFSVIEEKESLNHISRIILFLFLIFVAYFIFKNVYLYFSGYQINYNPLK